MLNTIRALCVQKGPEILRYPLKYTPQSLKHQVIQQCLSAQFHVALAEGELDFLQGRWLGVTVTDLDLRWCVSVDDGRLRVTDRDEADVWFRGNANDLLLIAAGKRDPDMLFFQRRLLIEGDTELGLEVKNVMDAMALDTLPAPLRFGLLQLAAFVEAGLTEDATSREDRAGASC
ncbi:hypothetical protein CIG19_04880 [Enterobacterales bacterium CwR94]|nr:hypothetical protein CIG19_04880 [Enterobacterales bacterium CwR94]